MATMRLFAAYAPARARGMRRWMLETRLKRLVLRSPVRVPGAVAVLLNPLIERNMFDEAEQIPSDTRVQELARQLVGLGLGGAAAACPARGRMRLAEGRTSLALADLLRVATDIQATPIDPRPLVMAIEAALALAALGSHERAGVLAEQELASPVSSTHRERWVSRCGRAGSWPQAATVSLTSPRR